MLCNISQNAMGQWGGYPARSSWGGTLAGGGTQSGTPPQPGQDGGVPWPGGYLTGYPPGGYPGWGGPWSGTPLGGYPGRGGTLVRYPPRPGQDGGGTLLGGGTQVGQQKEYSLHGGRYASCVHAGGLSCLIYNCFYFWKIQYRVGILLVSQISLVQ